MPRKSTITLLFLGFLSGCGGGGAGSTPQATFDSMKSAYAKKDYPVAVSLMSGDMQEMLLASCVMAVQMPLLMPGGDADKFKGVQAILDKHGVKPLDMSKLAAAGGGDRTSIMKSLTGDVKDKPAALAELMAYLDKNGDVANKSMLDEVANSTLSDVKIEGDKATGKIKSKRDGKETEEQTWFKKVNGKWYTDLNLDKAAMMDK